VTEIKVCGLTRKRDVELASELGAAFLGFNFSAVSPRRVTVGAAKTLARAAGKGTAKVGVFVEESRREIEEAIVAAGLDLVQIHRPLRREDLDLPVPVLAVARLRGGCPELPESSLLARCRMVLLDSALPGRPGGTGAPLDWNALSGRSWPVPLMLAGGLNPENVGDAIGRVRPAAVDVASGIESSPGVKDERRMKAFVAAVRRADFARR
jgi:phosphoribosylanthranilate isomerase